MDDVDKVKQKLDIREVIGSYVTLKKAGRNYKANCPFHNEHTPSFVVSPDRQIWHCFGCGKGGDIFSFVMEREGIPFAESLKYLADQAGITLNRSPARSENEKKRDLLYTINYLTAQYYHYLLLSHRIGIDAKEYVLGKRKLNQGLVETFLLGYAPAKESALSDYLMKKKGYKAQDLLDAGLAFQKGGRIADFFRNRIIFPIHDPRGNIIAFSGRALTDTTGPKYINTRETIIYKKRESLYGIFQAKDAIRKEETAILVEGEFDVITAHKEGILNIVAVKGTALTEDQILLLKRYAHRLIFSFDTDVAGNEAQKRSIALIEKYDMNTSVAQTPEAKDPDELLNSKPSEYKKAVKNPVNIYEYLLSSSSKNYNPKSADGKRAILDECLPILSHISNEIIKEHFFKQLANLLDTSLESIERQAQKVDRIEDKKVTETLITKASREELLEDYLLALLFQSQSPKNSLESIGKLIMSTPFPNPSTKRMIDLYQKSVSDNEKLSIEMFAKTLPSELLERFDKAYITPLPPFSNQELFNKELIKTARELKTIHIKNRISRLAKDLEEAEKDKKEEKAEKVRKEIVDLTHELR